jgi:hypothetical protein
MRRSRRSGGTCLFRAVLPLEALRPQFAVIAGTSRSRRAKEPDQERRTSGEDERGWREKMSGWRERLAVVRVTR